MGVCTSVSRASLNCLPVCNLELQVKWVTVFSVVQPLPPRYPFEVEHESIFQGRISECDCSHPWHRSVLRCVASLSWGSGQNVWRPKTSTRLQHNTGQGLRVWGVTRIGRYIGLNANKVSVFKRVKNVRCPARIKLQHEEPVALLLGVRRVEYLFLLITFDELHMMFPI